MRWRARRRRFRELTVAPGPSGRARRPLVAVCDRAFAPGGVDSLAASVRAGASDVWTEVDLVVIGDLCRHPGRLGRYCARRRPAAVVAVACHLTGAAAAAAQATQSGVDLARTAYMAVTPAGADQPGDPPAGGQLPRPAGAVTACEAAARRVTVLAGQPPAPRRRPGAGQPIDRRGLLAVVRGVTHTAAWVDTQRCWGTGRCTRCSTDCPVAAIDTSAATAEIDPDSCIRCGRCVVTCPAHAITMPGADLEGLAAQVDAILDAGATHTTLVCEREPAGGPATAGSPAFTVTLPCVAVLGAGARLQLAARGTTVELRRCSSCHCAPTVEGDERLVESLTRVLPPPARRETTGAPPPAPQGMRWREPVATSHAVTQRLGGRGQNPPAPVRPVTIVERGAATRILSVDLTACSACGACGLACPSAALAVDPATRQLTVDSAACNGCGRCLTVCPERCLTVTAGLDLASLTRGPSTFSVAAPSRPCASCGAPYQPDPAALAVIARLQADDKPPALIAALGRCPRCANANSQPRPTQPWAEGPSLSATRDAASRPASGSIPTRPTSQHESGAAVRSEL